MGMVGVRAMGAQVMFKAPGEQVNGLEAVAEGLWLCDQRDNHCYLIDYDGRTLSKFPGPARNASGVTFGAGSVWVASNTRPAIIFRHDAQTGHCTAYIVLSGEGGVHGLQWRPSEVPGTSGTLWVSRPGAHRIEHLDAETGDMLGSMHFEPPRSHGMFWDDGDGTLSVAETNGGHILRFDPKNAELLDEWRVEGPEVHGLTRSADGRIWIGDASTNQILTVRPHGT
jgi:outer membrane protein assembly factor BamB